MKVEFGTTELQATSVFQNVQLGSRQRVIQITCEDPDPDDTRYISVISQVSEVTVTTDNGTRKTFRYVPEDVQYTVRFGPGTPQVVIVLPVSSV